MLLRSSFGEKHLTELLEAKDQELMEVKKG
jgi:hypothetical protein